MPTALAVTVIIITRNRPQMVRDCLEHLRRQTAPPAGIIVVDSSTSEDTQAVLGDYPEVARLRIPDGRNNMPQARNLGLAQASGQVIAFLDDDSMAQPDWLCYLLVPYANPAVGGVGGRVIDALELERSTPSDPRIGLLQQDGKMTTNFVLAPDHPIEVDHVRGCNMSFRLDALKRIGAFDPRYIGSNVGEETDVCLGIKRAGYKLLYQPLAVVDHLAAPREGMNRDRFMIEPKQVLWSAHNRAYLFFKNFGYGYAPLKHILGRMQFFFIKLLFQEPGWARARAVVLYALGAWWGLADSLTVRLRPTFKGGPPAL